MRQISIRGRMYLVFAVLAAILAVIAVAGIYGLRSSNEDLAEVYHERLIPLSQLAHVNNLMHDSIEQLIVAVVARPNTENMRRYTDRVEDNLSKINNVIQTYFQNTLGADKKDIIKEWELNLEKLISKGIKPAMGALGTQGFNDAEDIILGVAVKQFAVVQKNFDTITSKELKNAELAHDIADDRYWMIGCLVIGVVLFGFGLCAVMALYVNRSITGPLFELTIVMRRLADGDMGIAIPASERSDEIGGIANALGVFKETAIEAKRLSILADKETADKEDRRKKDVQRSEKDLATREESRKRIEQYIDKFKNDVTASMLQLTSASVNMQSTAERLSKTASSTAQQAATVTAASEEATTSVTTVASAAEELSASVAEIARQTQESQKTADHAVEQAHNTNETVRNLQTATSKITNVMQLINDIASQTNLLALNATIEAARAGEAGKGFAVVASEVKNLAGQTAKATEEVGGQIVAMQRATSEVVGSIEKIGLTISRMSKMAIDISHVVEQQSSAVQEIAQNASHASKGTESVSANIVEVSQAASNTGTLAEQVLQTSEMLSKQSDTLRADIDDFLNKIQAM